jgi:hypothetical protein
MENYITEYIQEKGYTVQECRKAAPKKEFPCTIGSRHFETEEAYREALHDFLNGY